MSHVSNGSKREDRLRVLAHVPGRLRVRAETFRILPEVAREVVERVREEPGVSSVSSSEITGSVLVLYDPVETQILRLLRTIVLTGGLAGLEVDRAPPRSSPPGDRLRGALGDLDARVRAATRGELDLRVGVPGGLVLLGLGRFLAGPVRIPEWYDLLFWSFVVFSNLNPRVANDTRGASSGEASPRSGSNGSSSNGASRASRDPVIDDA